MKTPDINYTAFLPDASENLQLSKFFSAPPVISGQSARTACALPPGGKNIFCCI